MDLNKIIADGDVQGLADFAKTHGLVLRDGKLVAESDEAREKIIARSKFFDGRQMARKTLLNSLYGALLNEGLRFHDPRMGQSVTLTGRSIARHMNAKINEIIAGVYDHTGDAIVYADTDSSYFSASPMMGDDFNDNRDLVIELYDKVADAANESFPDFMDRTFNTGKDRGAIIAAGRELVASKALFIKKKKYACLIYDLEGTRLDGDNNPGKLKAMGLDLKRADTPAAMQNFLTRCLMDILTGAEEKQILSDIADFRLEFAKWKSWEKGSPKKVNNLSKYSAIKKNAAVVKVWKATAKEKKQMIPGHVEASLNWNHMLDLHGDRYSMRITDGSRIVVCKLKPNHLQMKAIAYPVDEPHLPEWFRGMAFDDTLMEETIIDKKVSNLVSVLGWNLKATKHSDADEFIVF